MRARNRSLLLLCVLACGCGQSKSTTDLIGDLKSGGDREKLVAVRLLQQKKGDAAQVVPALAQCLKDKDSDIRWSAAIGLGYFGEQARDAIAELKTAQRDSDARVREAAGVALFRIDPDQFPDPTKQRAGKAK
jgi:HEAT repeat protein